ncbi:MAG: metal ABC transporter ATP-binding protein [Alphaproteobacteria bacterium]|nr:metal ABC transporter ATP-binding protein [Alphaproteobacteria bacterium]
MTLIELKNIGLKIAGKQVVESVSLQIKRGKITTLIGPNGGGKTSLARIILDLIQPTTGKVLRMQKMRLGYMPQKLTIEKSIPISARDFVGTVDHKLAKRLNVEKVLDEQIHTISGGQLQKILFLRALAGEPDLIVLDEPTQYLDVAGIHDFYQIIEEVRKERRCTILLISHDLHLVMQKTDLVFCVNRHICCHGHPDDINQHPEYLSLFGVYQHHHNHRH